MDGSSANQLVKAYIYDEDKQRKVVDCLFNPTEYTFTKNNSWQRAAVGKDNVPKLKFQAGGDMTMTVSLLFDTYTMKDKPDVRKHTEEVLKLMRIDPSIKDALGQNGRPHLVSFRWGDYWSFKSVITNVTQRFTMFWPNGRPARATLDVTFTQVKDEGTHPPTNPTSVAVTQKVRVVSPGETIDSIAFEEYGDAKSWRLIADYNELDNPLRLRPGQKLAIPPRS